MHRISHVAPRLSAKEMLVLDQLAHSEELYGLQLVAGSRGRLKRGTVYVTLARMEGKGYVRSRAEAPPDGVGGLPRRLYGATPEGLRLVRAVALFQKHLAAESAR